MQEAFLHFIWKYKYFSTPQLQSVDGKLVTVVKAGVHNHDSGPDFLHAQVLIDNTKWAGHVEIHVKSSDWNLHGHSADAAYNNIILHVVYIDDRKNASDGPQVPVLELQNFIPKQAFEQYNRLLYSNNWVACAHALSGVDESVKNFWLERVLIDRLEQKSALVENLLIQNNNAWNQTAYVWLARAFGFKTNVPAFEELAVRTPLLLLNKHFNNALQVECLLFGQAGFLTNNFEEEYPQRLQKEYDFLRKKYNLQPMEPHRWKFMRMHPPNFPTIKIAEFAAIISKTEHLLQQILQIENPQQGNTFFSAEATEYWRTHFVFDKKSARQHKPILGVEARENLLINAIVPIIFCYGKLKGKYNYQEQAMHLLEQIPPENNHILRGWKMLGLVAGNAAQSQALIQLKNIYCNEKKCLSCGIGTSILRS